jgi:Ca-activated chloride channel family protein
MVELQPQDRLDRDFILHWQLASETVQIQLLTCPDPEDWTLPEEMGSGPFHLTLLPPISLPHSIKCRDLVLVLDRSGSMHGRKIVEARRAAARSYHR